VLKGKENVGNEIGTVLEELDDEGSVRCGEVKGETMIKVFLSESGGVFKGGMERGQRIVKSEEQIEMFPGDFFTVINHKSNNFLRRKSLPGFVGDFLTVLIICIFSIEIISNKI